MFTNSILFLFVIIGLVLIILISIFLLIRSRKPFRLSPLRMKEILIYPIQPSINTITRKLQFDFVPPWRKSRRNNERQPSILVTNDDVEQGQSSSFASRSSGDSILLMNNCSSSRNNSRRQSSIIDSKHISGIKFSLPPTTDFSRRRSIAVCNNLTETRRSTIHSLIQTIKSSNECLPCLLTFTFIYYSSLEFKIVFDSLSSLFKSLSFQQLNVKVKLIPDNKVKYIEIKQYSDAHRNTTNEESKEYSVRFSNISLEKLSDKSIFIKLTGKDQMKRNVEFGEIGKIHLKYLKQIRPEIPIEFIHEIEKIKLSSIELLVKLEQNLDRTLSVTLEQVKGIKINQKNFIPDGYFRILLLDRHRPLSTQQTKTYSLDSSNFRLDENFHFDLVALNTDDLDSLMIIIYFYSNVFQRREYRCLARIKFSSPYLASGSGIIQWQSLKDQRSLSMWHRLIKQLDIADT